MVGIDLFGENKKSVEQQSEMRRKKRECMRDWRNIQYAKRKATAAAENMVVNSSKRIRPGNVRPSPRLGQAAAATQSVATNSSKRIQRGSIKPAHRLNHAAEIRPQRSDGLRVLTDADEKRLFESCSKQLTNLNESACSVCDALHLKQDCVVIDVDTIDDVLMRHMRQRLKCRDGLNEVLKQQYDVSRFATSLSGMLLSMRGVKQENGKTFLRMCKPCLHSLKRSSRSNSPPKFAIANGLFMGLLPQGFADTTSIEHAMTNLAQPCHFISVTRGGSKRILKSHASACRAFAAPPATFLPVQVQNQDIVKVVIVGAMTPNQVAAIKKRHEVRLQRLQQLCEWYKRHNRLYANVEVSEMENIDVELLTRVTILQEEAQVDQATQLDETRIRFNGPLPIDSVSEAEETLEHNGNSLLGDFPDVAGLTGLDILLEQNARRQARTNLVVNRSNAFISDYEKSFWTYNFCELFPFGRGGFDENRQVPIGLEEFVRYCLRHSSRQFAFHSSFVFVAFDVIAKQRAFNAIRLRLQHNPQLGLSIASLDQNLIAQLCEYQRQRLDALRSHQKLPVAPTIAQGCYDFSSGIDTAVRAFWYSDKERQMFRTNLFSMASQFGQPSIFFTLSPCTSRMFSIAVLCGEIEAETVTQLHNNVNTLNTFTSAKLAALAGKNPCACAK